MLSRLPNASVSDSPPSGGRTSAPSWPTLLIVDSHAEMVQTLVCFFEKRGFHVAAVTTLAEAKELFHRRGTWTLVIADHHLPDGNGLELCCWMRDQRKTTPFLLMSGSPHGAALCEGADFLPKPFPLEKLEAYVRTVVRA